MASVQEHLVLMKACGSPNRESKLPSIEIMQHLTQSHTIHILDSFASMIKLALEGKSELDEKRFPHIHKGIETVRSWRAAGIPVVFCPGDDPFPVELNRGTVYFHMYDMFKVYNYKHPLAPLNVNYVSFDSDTMTDVMHLVDDYTPPEKRVESIYEYWNRRYIHVKSPEEILEEVRKPPIPSPYLGGTVFYNESGEFNVSKPDYIDMIQQMACGAEFVYHYLSAGFGNKYEERRNLPEPLSHILPGWCFNVETPILKGCIHTYGLHSPVKDQFDALQIRTSVVYRYELVHILIHVIISFIIMNNLSDRINDDIFQGYEPDNAVFESRQHVNLWLHINKKLIEKISGLSQEKEEQKE